MPTVSAVITTFNRADYLKLSIQSVLSQSYSDFELIILDNSSKDHTEEVVRSFHDERIRYLKHSPLNISETRNLGVREAQGEFIAFLDDDDEWLPNKLADQLALFHQSSEEVALVYGGFIRIDQDGKTFYTHTPVLKGKILHALLTLKDDFTGSASNPMIRKSLIEALGGFDETVKTGEDWEFYLRLTERFLVDFVETPVVHVRHHFGARLGDRIKDYIDLEMKVMNRFDAVLSEDRHLKSFYLQRIGGKLIRLGEVRDGRSYLIRALTCNRLNWVALFQWICSFFPVSFYKMAHRFYLHQTRAVKL